MTGWGAGPEDLRPTMIGPYFLMMELTTREGVYVRGLVYGSYGATAVKPTTVLTNVKRQLDLPSSCSQEHDRIMARDRAPTGELWMARACACPPSLGRACSSMAQEATRAGLSTSSLWT